MINKAEYSWLILLCAREGENRYLNQGGPIQIYRQAPTHWLKLYVEAVIECEARTAVLQLKSET